MTWSTPSKPASMPWIVLFSCNSAGQDIADLYLDGFHLSISRRCCVTGFFRVKGLLWFSGVVCKKGMGHACLGVYGPKVV